MMSVDAKQWILDPETEYRFELDPGTSLAIQLVRGFAEIFGAELVEGKTFVFGGECKAAVFTWRGCTIEVTGLPSTEYVSTESPMAAYANVHHALELMRVRALAAVHGSPVPGPPGGAPVRADPPRVLVVGPDNSGKTSLVKVLANYCVRAGQGWTPLLVNVDPVEGACAAPGTVSAAPLTAPLGTASSAGALGSAATARPVHLQSNALLPLVYWYGHSTVARNPLLLDRLIRTLGENIADRWDYDAEGRAAGMIVDTPGAFATARPGNKGPDYRLNLLKACVEAFRINVILVVGHEKLNVEMQRTFGEHINVVKVPKSGGAVELDAAYRERIQTRQLHAYMYGETIKPPAGITSYLLGGELTTDLSLSPATATVSFDDITIYRIGEETLAPSSALPIGAARVVGEMQPLLVDLTAPRSGLLNAFLALLAPPAADEAERYDEEVLDLHVLGFIVVTGIDVPNRRLTVLAPSTGGLVSKTAVVGSLEWTEPA